jgi:hypothetical protein
MENGIKIEVDFSEEIREITINKLYPNLSDQEKQELKNKIKIDFEKIEKPLLSSG